MHLRVVHRHIIVGHGDREVYIGRRSRLVASTAIVLGLHALVILMLVYAHPPLLELPDVDKDVIEAELYRPEPIPEPVPRPVIQTHELPKVQPQRQQAQPEPIPQPQPPTVTPEPYQPLPKVVPQTVEKLQNIKVPVVRTQDEPRLQSATSAAPTLQPEEAARPVITAKKKEDEALDTAKPQLATSAPDRASDLKLHDTPLPSVQAVAPSGLPAPPSQASAGGKASGAGAAGGAEALGPLRGGRSGVSQALQNHESCVDLQTRGKPVPPDCHMAALSDMKSLGPKADPRLQATVAAKEAYQRYKTQPGNTEYWKRVNGSPSPRFEPPEGPQPGAYSNPKDDKIMNGINVDPKAGKPY